MPRQPESPIFFMRRSGHGRALFDKAFKTIICTQRKFKTSDTDFFRTMEDASSCWPGLVLAWSVLWYRTDRTFPIDSRRWLIGFTWNVRPDSSQFESPRATVAKPAPSPIQRYEPLSKLHNRQSGIQFPDKAGRYLRTFITIVPTVGKKMNNPHLKPAPKRSNALRILLIARAELYKDYYVYEIGFQ